MKINSLMIFTIGRLRVGKSSRLSVSILQYLVVTVYYVSHYLIYVRTSLPLVSLAAVFNAVTQRSTLKTAARETKIPSLIVQN